MSIRVSNFPMMTKRIFPMADWAPAQEAMLAGPPSSSNPTSIPGENHASSSSDHPSIWRNKSRTLPWRHRPKSLGFSNDEDLASRLQSFDLERAPESSSGYHPHSQSASEVSLRLDAAGSTIRGIFRRASTSIKGKLGQRPLVASPISEESGASTRPGTSHSTWHRLRQAASFRQPRSPYLHEPEHGHAAELSTTDIPVPVPSIGGEPPIIPRNTGAAAKASVALQNEYMLMSQASQSQPRHSHGFQNKWLAGAGTPPGEDFGNDRESGIGITVASSVAESKRASLQDHDPSISRIDFISELPTELAIQILAQLDAAGLALASRVSKGWRIACANQHIWRDSFMREKTATYATSGPLQPGRGLGVPTVRPSNDWKEICRVKTELDRRWRKGEARPTYLHGHQDSIYCLQFDEYDGACPNSHLHQTNDFLGTKSSRAPGIKRFGSGICTRSNADSSSGHQRF